MDAIAVTVRSDLVFISLVVIIKEFIVVTSLIFSKAYLISNLVIAYLFTITIGIIGGDILNKVAV